MRVAITGASGLIGSALSDSLTGDGHEVLRMVRRPAQNSGEAEWRPESGYVDTGRLAGADAVVHLAGAPLGPARWTRRYKRMLRKSRTQATRTLAVALAGMDRPPPRLVSGSAVGFYGDTGAVRTGEDGPRGRGFLAELVADWEAATAPAAEAGLSVAHARTGVVLARSGGLLGTLLPLFRLGLGARLGSGRQYISWIALVDEVGALRFLIERPDITGPVNLVAPEPVTNASYTRYVARAVRRPALLAVPGFAMRAALGGFADEAALVSQRAVPERLSAEGYSFRRPGLAGALSDIA
ncbi:TIGR01777 family oxidoreductase [Streptomonospora wellingtoniae]|uniref:TIGR01777 family oxidoreductase n=1 Tax=Streptomonospora wellingtoniae TaxID=3075544 RepID=A0ABU2KP25_9ACTN|nr:TIGR01777 family oxidoreductase [Streptomonospora sp. DSM 45055]MDT0301022.1 TIGR01777 family oxidoreductase [Streptomonospora sp. DSM 45055]